MGSVDGEDRWCGELSTQWTGKKCGRSPRRRYNPAMMLSSGSRFRGNAPARQLLSVALLVVALTTSPGATPGGLDPAFGSGGKYLSTAYGLSMFGPSVAVQPNGSIVAVGKHFTGLDDDFAVLRLNPSGRLVSMGTAAFASNKNEDAKSVVALPDGRFLVGGEGNAGGYAQHGVIRFMADGTVDDSFGRDGRASVDFGRLSHIHAMALQADGKLVMVGESYGGTNSARLAMARLNTDGTLDTTFGTAGLVQASYGETTNTHAVVIAPDGTITVGGYLVESINGDASACFVARYRSTGAADTSFGSHGVTIVAVGSGHENYCHSLARQDDGMIVLAGSIVRNRTGDFMMMRFTTSGGLDPAFDGDGIVSTTFPGRAPISSAANAVLLLPDGKLVLGGHADGQFALARYSSAGALDPAFGTGGLMSFAFGRGVDDQIKSLALQPDGKIVAAGFTRDGSHFNLAVARLLGD